MDPRFAVLSSLTAVAPEVDPDTLDDDAELREACDLDSLDFLHLVEGVTALTGIAVPERDYPRLQTIAMWVEYLGERARQVS